jgi:2-hydroxychromene-2-carboxylate isomerase
MAMKQITFYLDFISPYAYLAFEELPAALQGLSYSVQYQPVVLGALLRHHGSLGPAEIPAKRDWTYRHVMWLAQSLGLKLDMPALHPFNPMSLLRLAVATDPGGLPNRYVCETLFRHVWQGGADAVDAARLQALAAQLAPARTVADDTVKAQLKSHTDAAMALRIFGVPAFEVDGKVFWGLDALPMLRAYLEGDAWFSQANWDAPTRLPSGLPPAKA